MKEYEALFTNKMMPYIPTIARLDGKAFHTWTKGLDRPFDTDFLTVMKETTKDLVSESNAILGYTQSDEITLLFYSGDPRSQIFFDGKHQKLISVLASMCTRSFYLALDRQIWECNRNEQFDKAELLANKPIPLFDCRVFQVPNKEEAVNCLIWREQDAVRNSILSVGQSKFSHQEMQNKSCAEVQEMLFQKYSINWGEDFSPEEKRGAYYKNIKTMRPFTAEEIESLPPKHEARTNPNLVVERHGIKKMDYPILTKISNRAEVIFDGVKPILKSNLNPTELESDIREHNA